MKALIFHGPGRISVEDVPEPVPAPGELVLRVQAAAICYSDIRVYRGEKKARAGVVPGHETAGVVQRPGEGVRGFSDGQAVVVCPIVACGRCDFCLRGLRNRCPERVTLGYETDGGLAEYMLVPRRLLELGHLLPVPEGLPLETAALTRHPAPARSASDSAHVFFRAPASPGQTLGMCHHCLELVSVQLLPEARHRMPAILAFPLPSAA